MLPTHPCSDHTVGMNRDGMNKTPALKRADVGAAGYRPAVFSVHVRACIRGTWDPAAGAAPEWQALVAPLRAARVNTSACQGNTSSAVSSLHHTLNSCLMSCQQISLGGCMRSC